MMSGCSDTNSADGAPTADEMFSQGVTYLEDSMSGADLDQPPWEWEVDMAEANAYFEDALDVDPDHCGALLMAAITRMALVLQDPDLADVIQELFPDDGRGPDGPGTFLFRALQRPDVYAAARRLMSYERDALPFSDLQDFVESDVLPALEYADGNLTQFEDQDCVVLLYIEVEEKREAVEIEIDVSDVFIMHAPLDVLQSLLYMAVSYNVDVAEGQTLQDLIDDDPDFLSLRPGDHMASAYSELLDMEDHLRRGAWSLADETDPQDTDLFTDTDDEGWIPLGEGFADTLSSIADEIHDALTSGVTFNPADDTGEPGAPDIDIVVDLEEFFTDPLDPVTDYFPAHTWSDSMTMEVVRPIDFPDPSFSDITPGMSDGDWGDDFDWLERVGRGRGRGRRPSTPDGQIQCV